MTAHDKKIKKRKRKQRDYSGWQKDKKIRRKKIKERYESGW